MPAIYFGCTCEPLPEEPGGGNTGVVPVVGGGITGIVVALVGGLMTPFCALPPGTSAWPEGAGAGTTVCGPELSGGAAGVVCAAAGPATASTSRAANAVAAVA